MCFGRCVHACVAHWQRMQLPDQCRLEGCPDGGCTLPSAMHRDSYDRILAEFNIRGVVSSDTRGASREKTEVSA
jgi:hypothetical protein